MAVTNYYSINGVITGEEVLGGSRTDYLTDALGSVVATVNPSAQVVNTYRYKPYCALLAKTGGGSDPSFQWVGSLGYRQTGKSYAEVYVRARHYSSVLGRWTTEEVLDSLMETNQYAYSYNNPPSFVDRTGRAPIVAEGSPPFRGFNRNPGSNRAAPPGKGKPLPIGDPRVHACRRRVERIGFACRDAVDAELSRLCGGKTISPIRCWRSNACLPDCSDNDAQAKGCNLGAGQTPGSGRATCVGRCMNNTFCCTECMVRACCWVGWPCYSLIDSWQELSYRECARNPNYQPSDICQDEVIRRTLSLCP